MCVDGEGMIHVMQCRNTLVYLNNGLLREVLQYCLYRGGRALYVQFLHTYGAQSSALYREVVFKSYARRSGVLPVDTETLRPGHDVVTCTSGNRLNYQPGIRRH